MFSIYVWHFVGRDPKSGAIVPEYYPPENMGPGAMRYIIKMDYDVTAAVAAIMNMAVKGAIYINVKNDKEYEIIDQKDKAASATLTSGENALYSALFCDKDKVIFDKDSASDIYFAFEQYFEKLEGECSGTYFKTNLKYIIPSGLIVILMLAVQSFFSVMPEGFF